MFDVERVQQKKIRELGRERIKKFTQREQTSWWYRDIKHRGKCLTGTRWTGN